MDYEKLFAEKMDGLITAEMERTNTPGTALAVVENGQIVLTRTYGAKNFELNSPVNADTLFNVASVTKSFISAGILKLQEQGKLNVTDRVSDYLPITIGFDDDPILIHHLMSHSSGIPNLTDSMWSRNREHLYGIQNPIPRIPFTSWDDGFRYLNGSQEYLSKSGRRFHYNNFAYGILSKLITEVSGEDYKSYLHKEIFSQLRMDRTGFFSEVSDDPNLARGYMDKLGSSTREFIHVPYAEHKLTRSLDEAAGGLFSTVKELANYMKMQLSGGEFEGKHVLSQESISEMQKRQFKEKYPSASFSAAYGQKVSGYAFGFAIDDDFLGHKLVQHSGSFIGASAWFAFLPEFGRGAIMLSNHHPSPRIFAQAILWESLGADVSSWPLLKLREHRSHLEGEYQTYKGMSKITITAAGGALYLKSGNDRMQLIPMSDEPTLDYYIPTEMGGKEPVQFEESEGRIFLNIERNRWKKVCTTE